MHALAKMRCHQMAKSNGTQLIDEHMRVLEYAWEYYRERRVGPLYTNIARNTGVARTIIENIFPNGLISVYTWVGIPIQTTEKGCKPSAMIEVENPREVYFDHNATTPIRQEVIDGLISFYRDTRTFGNPSSSYAIGGLGYDVIHRARQRIAKSLKVAPGEIFFSGSGSEANNLAIKGIAKKHSSGHIISTNVEHPSVANTLVAMEAEGYSVTYLPVAADGTLSAEAVDEAIKDDTILVTIMAANNEIGSLYPIAEIGEICQQRSVPFHVDAIQAFGKIPLNPKACGIDMLTLSGHKIYAPKGIAAIYVDKDTILAPQIHGGGQERGLRSGTENVGGIYALGLAAEYCAKEMEETNAKYNFLRQRFLSKLANCEPDAIINGSMDFRLPHNLSVGFANVDSGSLLLSLDQIGVYVSAGSACSAGDDSISHVLQAIGVDSQRFGTIRFSFGRDNTKEDIDYLFEHLPKILDQLRVSPAPEPMAASGAD
jgi:cysteine desulfurase